MLRHICMFTIKEDKEENIRQFLSRAEALSSLSTVRRFEAVRNCPETPASNYDVSLIIDFDDVEGLGSYQTDPVHLEFAKFLSEIKEDRACIDYIL